MRNVIPCLTSLKVHKQVTKSEEDRDLCWKSDYFLGLFMSLFLDFWKFRWLNCRQLSFSLRLQSRKKCHRGEMSHREKFGTGRNLVAIDVDRCPIIRNMDFLSFLKVQNTRPQKHRCCQKFGFCVIPSVMLRKFRR